MTKSTPERTFGSVKVLNASLVYHTPLNNFFRAYLYETTTNLNVTTKDNVTLDFFLKNIGRQDVSPVVLSVNATKKFSRLLSLSAS